jgi:hypothetical protein
MTITRHLRCSLTVAIVLAATLIAPATNVFAQYGAMRWYQRGAQQQWQYLQKQKQAMDKQQQEEYDAFMKRFDTNKNGKIDGKEKGPAQKYLRKLEMGQDPDKSIKSLGRPSSTSRSARKKPASTK